MASRAMPMIAFHRVESIYLYIYMMWIVDLILDAYMYNVHVQLGYYDIWYTTRM